jgi:hypothetical protein
MVKASMHIQWIYIYSQQIGRILEANINLNNRFFISKGYAHFCSVILVDSHLHSVAKMLSTTAII